jgi:hypothetical protein
MISYRYDEDIFIKGHKVKKENKKTNTSILTVNSKAS